MKKLVYLIAFVFIIELICMFSSVYGENVTLAWDPNSEPEVIGYNIYFKNHINEDYRLASEIFESDFDNPLFPEITFWGLNVNMPYYYVATAFSPDEESGHSNEVIWTYNPDDPGTTDDNSGGAGGGCFIDSIRW